MDGRRCALVIYLFKQVEDLFADMAAILISIVSNSYYGGCPGAK